jgi:hypothetical protein
MNMITQSIEALSPGVGAFLTKALEDGCRYRWLRNNARIDWVPDDGVCLVFPEPDTGIDWPGAIDRAIDAEINLYLKEQGIE